MDHMEHFAMGQWLLLLAYLTSVVGCALRLACTLQARSALTPRRRLRGGLVTGLAVNVMPYTGMWAVQIKGTITYDVGLVALSVVIAVIAATVALWFTAALDKFLPRLVAGFVMGIAVTGMHYTGM